MTRLKVLVGAARFELATPSPPDWCANRAALRSADRLETDDLRPGGRARKGGRAHVGRHRHQPPEHRRDQDIVVPVVDIDDGALAEEGVVRVLAEIALGEK